MSNKSFYKNSFMLILSNLTTGVLGFLFSIILSRSLGAEGMGLYGLVMPIYNLFICLICGGIVTAISKISVINTDKKDFENVKKNIKTLFKFNIMWGIIIAFIVFLLAPNISSVIIKDSRTALALRITCPAMVFIAASNILKGYFYGTAEITGFTQYITGLMLNHLPLDLNITVSITSVNGPEVLIVKKPNEDEPFVHIYE